MSIRLLVSSLEQFEHSHCAYTLRDKIRKIYTEIGGSENSMTQSNTKIKNNKIALEASPSRKSSLETCQV